MRITIASLFFALTLAACATEGTPDQQAWAHVRDMTNATYLGNDRLKVTTEPAFFRGAEAMEFALLARAAGEAKARGADRFAIVSADYGQSLNAFSSAMPPIGRTWIGNYEELLQERERQAEGFGPVTGATFIVLMAAEDNTVLRETFDAGDTYSALLAEWKRRKRIKDQ